MSEERPHLIFVMADQLRHDVPGFGGGAFGATRHLDALAADSVVFERHVTNCPLCVPARVSLATGAYPHVNGALVNAFGGNDLRHATGRAEYATFYESLAAAGYRVEHIGVNHLRCQPRIEDRRDGIHFSANRGEYARWCAQRGVEMAFGPCKSPCVDYAAGRRTVAYYTNPNTLLWPHAAEDFFEFWLARRAVEIIEQADPAQPLALLCNFWAPHCPLSCPEPYFSRFDRASLALPANVGQWYDGQCPMHLLHCPGHVAASTTMEGWRRAWGVYLGMVSLLDEAVGRLIDALKRRGLYDDAVMIFSADHGEMLGSHRMFQKMCCYEEAIRVPLLIKAPGVALGRRDVITQHLDMAATICDLCGAELAATSQGESFRKLIEDPRRPGRTEVFVEYNGNVGLSFQQRAIVTEQYKYVYNHGYEPELYDLAADPGETRNLIAPDRRSRPAGALQARLLQWMEQTKDILPDGQ